jgi:hypothetical protein
MGYWIFLNWKWGKPIFINYLEDIASVFCSSRIYIWKFGDLLIWVIRIQLDRWNNLLGSCWIFIQSNWVFLTIFREDLLPNSLQNSEDFWCYFVRNNYSFNMHLMLMILMSIPDLRTMMVRMMMILYWLSWSVGVVSFWRGCNVWLMRVSW